MSMNVVKDKRTDLTAAAYVGCADIFRTFAAPEVDSGNISFGVRDGKVRYFLKTAGDPTDAATLNHAERVALLRNSVRIHQSCPVTGVPRLLNLIEAHDGPLLVYEWVDGERLGGRATHRANPASAHQRFRSLPVQRIVDALDVVITLHEALALVGWVAVDFYDGSLLYGFADQRRTVVDIDHYHDGPFVNTMGRMFGSERFMAPEEFERVARIDQQTTVFTLGRLVAEFLGDSTAERDAFRGPNGLYEIMVKACCPDRSGRFASVAKFSAAWRDVVHRHREPAR